jgi:hypothetical protein
MMGLSPTRFHWCNARPGDSPEMGTVVAHFPQSAMLPTGQKLLFNRPVTVRTATRRPVLKQCTRCWGFHSAEMCSKPHQCSTCASSEHRSEAHADSNRAQQTLCAVCLGQHPATDPQCPLRPKYNKALGRLEAPDSAMVRQVRAANRASAKAAKQTAAASQPTPSQPPSGSGSTDGGNTSPTPQASQ